MDKEILVVVSSEAAAYEVVRAFEALDREGTIELHSFTVTFKADSGTFTAKEERRLRSPGTVALATSTGALLGLLGGPIALAAGATAGAAAAAAAAGVAVGGTMGGTAAVGGDLTYSEFASELLRPVVASLKPGSYVVAASIYEDSTGPVDAAVAPHGTVVFRQATDDVVVAGIKADWQAMNDALDRIEAEIDRSVGEEKAKLLAKRDELLMEQNAGRAALEARVRLLQESWDHEIANVKAKADAAEARAAARHAEHARKLSRFVATQKRALHDLFT
ncbi:MAG: hypothetical protein AMXMBFR56_43090 [Polyangiaceae bacterium]